MATRLAVIYNKAMENDLLPGPTDEREDIQELALAAEAVLFASAEAVVLTDLRKVLEIRTATLERVLDYLGRSLADGRRGLRLQRYEDTARLVTAPETALYIQKLRGQEATQRLSDAALETLALIAYRQPATRPQIEAIRGVDCNGVVNTLIMRGLVAEVGRLETVGHAVLYGTTPTFLQHFGLESYDQLPPIVEFMASSERREAREQADSLGSPLNGAADSRA